MPPHAMVTKRCAFIAFFAVATLVLIFCGYYGTLPTAIRSYVFRRCSPVERLFNESLRSRGFLEYRFDNGRIRVTDSRYQLNQSRLAGLSAADLEDLYENVVLELTAECSTARRFGRQVDGGWDLCLAGPFTPQQPCFSFSFGVNGIWEFDDEVASQFKCQVVTFDPSMAQDSHMRSERVQFLREGLHAAKGKMDSWSVDSYLGYLKRFNAENLVVDILKMDIEFSEWPALQTAVLDGSLRNVKQLLIETHVDKMTSVQQYLNYFDVLRALHDLGFRMWHYNWNTFGNYVSERHRSMIRTCCHELYYININFLKAGVLARNPPGSQLARTPLARIPAVESTPPALSPKPVSPITKTPGFDQLETIRRVDMKAMSALQLETLYFTIVEQQHIACPTIVRIGDAGDGGWDVCLSEPFDIRKSRPCVAFSFGINNIWNYDDQLADSYNCRVHMFDPSMVSVNDHQRKKTSWFYRTGLSSANVVEANGWKMRTLCRLFQELGYADKTVDILKIDIEHWEWVSFEKAFQEGCMKQVKQLLFETHTSELVRQRSDYARFVRIWMGLFDLGFRTWKWHKNPLSVFYKSESSGVQRACCYEHYMLNTNLISL